MTVCSAASAAIIAETPDVSFQCVSNDAASAQQVLSHPDWLFELKHDGFRSYVRLGPSAVAAANKAKELKTRNMRRITAS